MFWQFAVELHIIISLHSLCIAAMQTGDLEYA